MIKIVKKVNQARLLYQKQKSLNNYLIRLIYLGYMDRKPKRITLKERLFETKLKDFENRKD